MSKHRMRARRWARERRARAIVAQAFDTFLDAVFAADMRMWAEVEKALSSVPHVETRGTALVFTLDLTYP